MKKGKYERDKDERYLLKMSVEDRAKLEQISFETGKSMAEILREGLNLVYTIHVNTQF